MDKFRLIMLNDSWHWRRINVNYHQIMDFLKGKKFLRYYLSLTVVLSFASLTINFLLIFNFKFFQAFSELLMIFSTNILFIFILLLKLNLNTEHDTGKIFTFFNRLYLILFFFIPLLFLSEIIYSFIFVNYVDVLIARNLSYICIQILFGYGSCFSITCLVTLRRPDLWVKPLKMKS